MATIVKGKNPKKPFTVRYSTQQHSTKCKTPCQVTYHQREQSFGTHGEAKDFMTKFEHDNRAGIFVDQKLGKIDFVQYCAAWIERRPIKPNSKKTYRSILNAQIKPVFAGKSLADVASDRDGVLDLVTGFDCGDQRKASALSLIRGTCDEAVIAGKIAKHRLDGLVIETGGIKPAKIIEASSDQLSTLSDALRPDLNLYPWIMRGCGLRASEALAVNLKDFRDGGRVLRVFQQVDDKGNLVALKHRKVNEYRDVPVPAWLWTRIEKHIAEFGTDDGFLFGHGKRVTYKSTHERFTLAAAKADLDGMTEHNLRHLFVSTLLSVGVPITDVATWVGHKDIRVTHAVYGHLLADSWTRGRDALDKILD